MAVVTKNHEDMVGELEDTLVQEFRGLQSLIALAKEERALLSSRNADALMVLLGQKESLLDELGLIEERRRMVTQNVATILGMRLESSSLIELLTGMEGPSVDRLFRLSEGIATLVGQARDLNYGNQTLSRAGLDWIAATQEYLLSFYQPQPGYAPPGAVPTLERVAIWDLDHRV
ncbi:MAG: flagellar protein FlgN [Chloroflexi bacterium]|nr:flagellar protein FlgN [Chloroflexota bacterium]